MSGLMDTVRLYNAASRRMARAYNAANDAEHGYFNMRRITWDEMMYYRDAWTAAHESYQVARKRMMEAAR
jgi:hypothetical protein